MHEFKPLFSDCHSKVSFSVKASFKPQVFTTNYEKMPCQYKWTQYSPEKFKRALNNFEIKSQIDSFISTQFDINDQGIDSACSKFEDIVISVANQSLSKKENNRTRYNKSKKWYDEQFYIKRRDLSRKASVIYN